MKKKKSISNRFKTSKSMDAYLDTHDLGEHFRKFGKLEKPKIKKINLDLPEWVLHALELEAARAGIARQPLIKLWLVQKLEEERKKRDKAG
jgi:predicted DNA binding CopG/RHH family protein